MVPSDGKKDEGLVTQLATEAESLANSTPLPRSAGGKIENRNFAKQEIGSGLRVLDNQKRESFSASLIFAAGSIFVAEAHRDDGKRFVVCAD
ncbi:MAG: hypothetical protein DME62_10220 [Verrucomicrobia bacterium]|nr:MAG: hypothetical protein DME62_10220 [Verrucomicrobiota bacterium]